MPTSGRAVNTTSIRQQARHPKRQIYQTMLCPSSATDDSRDQVGKDASEEEVDIDRCPISVAITAPILPSTK